MRNRGWWIGLVLFFAGYLAGCQRSAAPPATTNTPAEAELKLWRSSPPRPTETPASEFQIQVLPGSQAEAEAYYKTIRSSLANFPKATLAESSIEDMLAYFGYPAIPPTILEAVSPADIMDFERLRKAVGTPEFEAAYNAAPLQSGEISVVRFFAPKIVNVREVQPGGIPLDGFGWRKVLRFRSRTSSGARNAGLDKFYLLFNFTSGAGTVFPENVHAGQIQSILVPTYPTNGQHRDAYFLVYEGLGKPTPGKVGFYLVATFDLAGSVPDDKYYVPRACGQCHGTEVNDQKQAKVNYLDTDHWLDRTGDDFPQISAANVLVDGEGAYKTFRELNAEIAQQNREVLKQSGGKPFAALAAERWLELHATGQPNETKYVAPIHRGFAESAGESAWTAGAVPDDELVPLLNRYCFRCHSSVRYHVFQKSEVTRRKASIVNRIAGGNMPQDRTLDKATRERLIALIGQLQ
jgi:hypothetical protein